MGRLSAGRAKQGPKAARILEKKGSVPEKCLTYISSQKNMDRLNQLLDLAVASETVAEFEKKAGI